MAAPFGHPGHGALKGMAVQIVPGGDQRAHARKRTSRYLCGLFRL